MSYSLWDHKELDMTVQLTYTWGNQQYLIQSIVMVRNKCIKLCQVIRMGFGIER